MADELKPTTAPKTDASGQTAAELAEQSDITQEEVMAEQAKFPELNPDALIGNIQTEKAKQAVIGSEQADIELDDAQREIDTARGELLPSNVFSEQQARDRFGNDFTGLQKRGSGLYVADESAMKRAGLDKQPPSEREMIDQQFAERSRILDERTKETIRRTQEQADMAIRGAEGRREKAIGAGASYLAKIGAYLVSTASQQYLQDINNEYDAKVTEIRNTAESLIRQAEMAREDADFELMDKKRAQLNDLIDQQRQADDQRMKEVAMSIQIEKEKRSTLDQSINAWAEMDIEELPNGFAERVDSEAGYLPGTTQGLFQIAKREKRATSLTEQISQATAFSQLLQSQPLGTPIPFNGSIYYGTNTGNIKISDGKASQFTVDAQGNIVKQDLGWVGDPKNGFEYREINGKPYSINPQTRQIFALYPSEANWDVVAPEGEVWDNFGRRTSNQGECGALVNDIYTDINVGNTFESKMAMTNPDITADSVVVGDFLVQDIGGYTGHIAIVEEVRYQDGEKMLRLFESNRNGDHRTTHNNWISANDPTIKGYGTGTMRPEFQTGTDSSFAFGSGIEDLPTMRQLEARNLSVDIFGKKAGVKAENINLIGDLMREGRSVDQIRDDLRYSTQSEAFTGVYRDASENIALGMTEKQAERFMDSIDRNLEEGNTDKVLETMKLAAIKTFGTDEQKQIRGKDRTVEFLLEIKDDMKALKDMNIDTGIFNGTTEKIFGKVGRINNPKLRALATKVATVIQQYRRSMSGVAFSVPESKEYASIFPNIDKSFKYNEVVIDSLLDTFIGDLDYQFGASMGFGAYSELFGKGGGVVSSRQPEQQDSTEADSIIDEYLKGFTPDENKEVIL